MAGWDAKSIASLVPAVTTIVVSDLSEEFATIVNTDEVLRELRAPEPLVTA